MIRVFKNMQEVDAALAKWQAAFELEGYEILVKFVPFEELNKPGMNRGLFISTVIGGWDSPLIIKIASDLSKYKNKAVHKQHDELTLVRELLNIKRRLTDCPAHYLGAARNAGQGES